MCVSLRRRRRFQISLCFVRPCPWLNATALQTIGLTCVTQKRAWQPVHFREKKPKKIIHAYLLPLVKIIFTKCHKNPTKQYREETREEGVSDWWPRLRAKNCFICSHTKRMEVSSKLFSTVRVHAAEARQHKHANCRHVIVCQSWSTTAFNSFTLLTYSLTTAAREWFNYISVV